MQNFELIRQLGHGNFGQVFAARERITDFIVAIKKIDRVELCRTNCEQLIKREIIIQSTLSHPNILKLYGYFWDSSFVYLILEYAPGGQLWRTLKKKTRLIQQQVGQIISQVCSGVAYLHQKNVLHRDIKPQNLLLSGKKVKIADFGWSVHSHRQRNTTCGTLDYLSPQMVKGEKHTSGVDVWALGILAYQLAVGKTPFEKPSSEDTYHCILYQEVSFPPHVSIQLRHLIRKCLIKDQKKRISINLLLLEPFIIKHMNNGKKEKNE